VWMKIAENAKRTGGTVFVVHRTDGKGAYGCVAKGPGSLDGQAQEGEVHFATTHGCAIKWVGYSNTDGQAQPEPGPLQQPPESQPERAAPVLAKGVLPAQSDGSSEDEASYTTCS
jgi:hypothetical protein